MSIKRRKSRIVKIGNVKIGANNPISIQSMTKTDTQDTKATIRQIRKLKKIGCEIVRIAVKNIKQIGAFEYIRRKVDIPLVCDIHYNYKIALECIKKGADGIRLNPGNIYHIKQIKQIAKEAKKYKVPIRVGVNAGSLKPSVKCQVSSVKESKKHNVSDLMVKSALNYIKMLERLDFRDIIVSLKASDVMTTIDAYHKIAKLCNYPLHLGITATGLINTGAIKSAVGIGTLLSEGIGDTIRVSLSAPPEEEVKVAKEILSSLNLRNFGPEVISCPTCGRAQIDVIKIARDLQEKLLATRYSLLATHPIKVAIMGCEVNGPGEAKDADIGIAGGKQCGVLFRKGNKVKRVKESEMVDALLKETLGFSKNEQQC